MEQIIVPQVRAVAITATTGSNGSLPAYSGRFGDLTPSFWSGLILVKKYE